MATDRSNPIVHFVGSIPLPDAEAVFRTLAEAAGPYLLRLPDGETGIRKTWIRFLQDVLAENPAIEPATDVPPFKFTQWDGRCCAKSRGFASSRAPRPIPARSKPAMPRWR
jgi:hypothetical protein